MKVGIDLDDTITEIPWLFSILSKGLIAGGHEVHIITYRSNDAYTEDELKAFGIAYTKLHLPQGHKFGGKSIPKWKSAVAQELGLDVMFEDSPDNLSEMPANIKRIWICDPDIFDLKNALSYL